jgi:hypothetical protein
MERKPQDCRRNAKNQSLTQDVGNKAKGYVAAVMLFVFNFFFVSESDFFPAGGLRPALVWRGG